MAKEITTPDDSQFYTSNRDRFVTDFDKIRQAVSDYLSKQSTPKDAKAIANEAARHFANILPELPYIGGDNHPGTKFIISTGQWIAIYKSMVNKGYSTLEVAKMMYPIYEDQLKEIPPKELENQKAFIFSDDYILLMKAWAENPSPYESDWKVDYVEGDGVDFDYGLDFRACPCFELFKAHNAEQLAPFYCLLDFPEAQQLNSGLVRTKTLAQGDDVCNFRYKKGRELVQSWDTKIEKILAKQHQFLDNDKEQN